MLVNGIQAVGSKGVTALQGTVVDPRETARGTDDRDGGAGRAASGLTRGGAPQPVVFPRRGAALDQRPVGLRRERAAQQYRSNGTGPRGLRNGVLNHDTPNHDSANHDNPNHDTPNHDNPNHDNPNHDNAA